MNTVAWCDRFISYSGQAVNVCLHITKSQITERCNSKNMDIYIHTLHLNVIITAYLELVFAFCHGDRQASPLTSTGTTSNARFLLFATRGRHTLCHIPTERGQTHR